MTKICCVCQRVEHGSHWREDYQFGKGERVTHGYCPLCFDVIMAELMDDRDDLFQAPVEDDANGVRELPSSICA
jgi:hypothetical protein